MPNGTLMGHRMQFGATFATGDPNGDGLLELMVGAPSFSNIQCPLVQSPSLIFSKYDSTTSDE